MKKKFTHYLQLLLVSIALFQALPSSLKAQAITENFDNISTLTGNGWEMTNNSSPKGLTNWMQGDGPTFAAYNGVATSYISANYNNTGNTGTISNFLMTPNRTFRNGDVITFYTRTVVLDIADRLEVRLSTNGASTNVGSTATSTGDFTTLLLQINPTLSANIYPITWTQYTITISGLPAPTSGRLAFRYFVTGAGALGANSNYIGIDNFVYTPYICPTITISNTSLSGGSAGTAYSTNLSQTGALGAPNFAITAGALPPGLTLSASGTISGTPTATGTFNFTVTASDASGCSGSKAYSITVVCPANPTSLTLPVVCSNEASITLTGGSPGGGTYSGTGVSGGEFDPSAGTQTITYDYTDPYGCSFSSSETITVNQAPAVTASSLDAVCKGSDELILSFGSPAGGTYTGTNVAEGKFNPSTAGTTSITYSYTDANGCSASASSDITVNELPTVTAGALSDVCKGSSDIILDFGSPAGGTYSGTNVASGIFTPSTAGTTTITYSYTDANGCSASASSDITVNDLPTVTAGALSDVCKGSSDITLDFGSPAGGTYSGDNVAEGVFSPSTTGTTSITYTYVDNNGCAASASSDINVTICTSISSGVANSAIKCYPNPSLGKFTVEFDSKNSPEITTQITDAHGKIIIKEKNSSATGAYYQTFDLTEYPKGMYTISILSENKLNYYKIVVQ